MTSALPNLECGDWSLLSPTATCRGAGRAFVGDKSPTEESGDKSPHSKSPWPHAPVHKLTEHGVYMVTGGTLQKQRWFSTVERLALLESKLLGLANQYQWQIEAWAVFPNHYHFVARGCPTSADLRKYVTHLHADTARAVNRLDGVAGRKIWFNYWDTRLTFQTSYLARLNYVHQNAVKHGVVPAANQYRWCSAAWFERVATPAMVQTIYNLKTDEVQVQDDF